MEPCVRLVCRGTQCVASSKDCAQLGVSTTPAPSSQTGVSTSIVAIITVLLFIGAIVVAFVIGSFWGDDRRQ